MDRFFAKLLNRRAFWLFRLFATAALDYPSFDATWEGAGSSELPPGQPPPGPDTIAQPDGTNLR
jgi:hypothetical protein